MSRRDAFEAALNAVLGDYLEARESSLAIQMGLYRRGQPLDELPHGTAKLCVLVHGMACNERCWAYPDDPDTDYGVLLEKEHGLTPLYVRYNTGLTIRTSGQHLAALLQSVVDRSPVPVQELTLIGHSLGGLLIRSACHQGQQSSWLPLVRRAFYLGSPHLGSPLEKAGHVATSVLHAIDDPVVQLLGDLAEVRSAAVKDLRYGTLANDGAPVPLDERIEHYLVAGSLPGPLAALLGDGVVRVASATGVSASRAGAVDAVGLFPGLHHMAILHHPKVYAWIARRCGPAQPTIPVAPSLRAYPPRRTRRRLPRIARGRGRQGIVGGAGGPRGHRRAHLQHHRGHPSSAGAKPCSTRGAFQSVARDLCDAAAGEQLAGCRDQCPC